MTSLPVLGFTIAGSLGALATLGVLVTSAIYDVRNIKKQAPLRKKPNAREYKRRPLVSVVVLASNDIKTITECLKSITGSNYRKHEIIVIDNASTDYTATEVKAFISAHPRKDIRLINKRKPRDSRNINNSARRSAKGVLVMMIPATAQIMPDTIKRAVNHFLLDDNLGAITGRRAVRTAYSVSSNIAQLGSMVRARISKTKNVLRMHASDQSLVMYRRTQIKSSPIYANDVVFWQQKKNVFKIQPTFSQMFTWLCWLLLAVALGYVWYIALYLKVVQPLGLLWLSMSVCGLLFVLGDDYLGGRSKMRIVSLLPAWFVLSCLFVLGRVLSPLSILTRMRIRISLSLAS